MTLSSLLRPNIAKLTPYSSGKSEFSGKADIFLDTNENPFGDGILNRYPDPLQEKVLRELSEQKKCSSENIVLGNGSDELIDLLVRMFCEPEKDSLVFCSPTFGMYRVAADINAVKSIDIPLDSDFQLDTEKILSFSRAENFPKILFLCHPNNPTGNAMEQEKVELLLQEFPGIVVIDEAYSDFCSEKSFLSRLSEFPRLVVLQTFSKLWGLAGVRLGMAFASEEIIRVFRSIKAPYNINVLTAEAAHKRLLENKKVIQERDLLLEERKKMRQELERISCVQKIFLSDANFLLVRFSEGNTVYNILLKEGIVVRNFSQKKRLENCLRITVGTPEENEALLKVLQNFSKNYNN